MNWLTKLAQEERPVGDQWRIAQAEKIRAAMGPEMCSVADALRETFGAKITWLETPSMSLGTKLESEPIGEKGYLASRKRA